MLVFEKCRFFLTALQLLDGWCAEYDEGAIFDWFSPYFDCLYNINDDFYNTNDGFCTKNDEFGQDAGLLTHEEVREIYIVVLLLHYYIIIFALTMMNSVLTVMISV